MIGALSGLELPIWRAATVLGTSHCSLLVVNEYMYASVVGSITVLTVLPCKQFSPFVYRDCANDSSPGLRVNSPGVPANSYGHLAGNALRFPSAIVIDAVWHELIVVVASQVIRKPPTQ